MGWSDAGDGCFDGDGPADAISNGLAEVAAEGVRRSGSLPTGAVLLRALVEALNHDGARAPFYSEPQRIEAMLVMHGDREVRIEGAGAPRWMVRTLCGVFEQIAEEYLGSWSRPPHLRELARYLDLQLSGGEFVEESFREIIADASPWKLRTARFVLASKRKPNDPLQAPDPEPVASAAPRRVRHPKFGEGVVLGVDGDRVRASFGGGEPRVLLKDFITWLD